MKKLICLLATVLVFCGAHAAVLHTIRGTVTDFEGKPIVGATVEVKNKNFEALYSAQSDAKGHYSINVEDGIYESITCIKTADYGRNNLEFWAWNVPVHADMTLDMRYHRLEMYGLHAFVVPGAYPGAVIYFRPMSLSRYPDFMAKGAPLAPAADKLEVSVEVNGKPAKINSVQPVVEFEGKDKPLTGFIVQIGRTGAERPDVDTIRVVAKDKETGDTGEGYYFRIKEQYR